MAVIEIKRIEGTSILPWRVSGAPSNGTSGTKAGLAEIGDLLIRTDTGVLFQNTNTKASPTWSTRT